MTDQFTQEAEEVILESENITKELGEDEKNRIENILKKIQL